MIFSQRDWFLCSLVAIVVLAAFPSPVSSRGHGGRACWDPVVPGANITCLEGHEGIDCGKSVCLNDNKVECIGGKCRCKGDYDKGDGMVVCAKPEEHLCYMVNDPRMKVFSGASVDIPVSCKYLMSSFETNILSGGTPVGQCIMEAYSWGVKGRGAGRKGKHFTGGMEIIITVIYGGNVYYHATRINGEGRDGVYRFSEQGSKVEGSAYGYAVETTIAGLGSIYTDYGDDYNHSTIAEVRADFCGVKMGFRPAEFHAVKADNQLNPGVYLKVNIANSRLFTGGLCLAPLITIKDVVTYLNATTGKAVDEETAMMYLVLKSAANQNFPGAPLVLQSIANMAQECDTKALICAIQSCLFITKLPKFLKCYGRKSIEDGGGSSGSGSGSSTSSIESSGSQSGSGSGSNSEESGSTSSSSTSGSGSKSNKSDSKSNDSNESNKSRKRRSASTSGDRDSKGSGSKDSDSKGSGSKDSDSKGSGSKDSDSKGSGSKDSDSKGSGSKDSDSKGSGSKDSDNEDSQSEDSQSEDSESEDSESEDSDSDSEDSIEREKDIEESRMIRSLMLMYRCFQSFCAPSSMVCELVQEKISNTQCDQFIPEEPETIMDVNCTTLDSASLNPFPN